MLLLLPPHPVPKSDALISKYGLQCNRTLVRESTTGTSARAQASQMLKRPSKQVCLVLQRLDLQWQHDSMHPSNCPCGPGPCSHVFFGILFLFVRLLLKLCTHPLTPLITRLSHLLFKYVNKSSPHGDLLGGFGRVLGPPT